MLWFLVCLVLLILVPLVALAPQILLDSMVVLVILNCSTGSFGFFRSSGFSCSSDFFGFIVLRVCPVPQVLLVPLVLLVFLVPNGSPN